MRGQSCAITEARHGLDLHVLLAWKEGGSWVQMAPDTWGGFVERKLSFSLRQVGWVCWVL